MDRKLESRTYHLSPNQLNELYRKYGRPGELSPGRPATRKRRRLDAALAALDRKSNSVLMPSDED
ncbi:hypothetical protein SAMN05660649_02279 [Desulfotomaculum arcticum]|uniref:Uncharacterized protein n=1 Tax=Desulfotruncus arcticus DSM 17038 TaxID=1121424 RepID=A0A1I2TIK8_9FIRM|nr:hypothetical protein [Desulfotruncus arcticus]SFG64670.1 hypothetical protein SAMN05660649_02279 [Desulfotomaculum arcticum] [Desulfotruncus arcticus DSM 17038]